MVGASSVLYAVTGSRRSDEGGASHFPGYCVSFVCHDPPLSNGRRIYFAVSEFILLHFAAGGVGSRRSNQRHQMNRIDHITLTMDFTRACGPVTEAQIAAELRRQHNSETAERDARNAIDHGTQHGWLEAYDEESFCMA